MLRFLSNPRLYPKGGLNSQRQKLNQAQIIKSRNFNGIPQQHPEANSPETQRSNVLFMIGSTVFTGIIAFIYHTYYNKAIHDLSDSEFRKFYIADIIPLTTDTNLYRFEANIESAIYETFAVPSHVIVKDDTQQIGRAYTPTSIRSKYFDLVVRKYANGTVSRFIHSKQIGDAIEMRGLFWSFPYESNMAQEIGMVIILDKLMINKFQIAGGTGITPFYQLIKSILKDTSDTSNMTLLYANRNESSILLRPELDALVQANPKRLRVIYTIDSPLDPLTWNGDVGRVTKELIQKHLPPSNNNNLIVVCGPDS